VTVCFQGGVAFPFVRGAKVLRKPTPSRMLHAESLVFTRSCNSGLPVLNTAAHSPPVSGIPPESPRMPQKSLRALDGSSIGPGADRPRMEAVGGRFFSPAVLLLCCSPADTELLAEGVTGCAGSVNRLWKFFHNRFVLALPVTTGGFLPFLRLGLVPLPQVLGTADLGADGGHDLRTHATRRIVRPACRGFLLSASPHIWAGLPLVAYPCVPSSVPSPPPPASPSARRHGQLVRHTCPPPTGVPKMSKSPSLLPIARELIPCGTCVASDMRRLRCQVSNPAVLPSAWISLVAVHVLRIAAHIRAICSGDGSRPWCGCWGSINTPSCGSLNAGSLR